MSGVGEDACSLLKTRKGRKERRQKPGFFLTGTSASALVLLSGKVGTIVSGHREEQVVAYCCSRQWLFAVPVLHKRPKFRVTAIVTRPGVAPGPVPITKPRQCLGCHASPNSGVLMGLRANENSSQGVARPSLG